MSQSEWPEEGRRPDSADRAGRRPSDDWGDQPPPPSGMSGGMKACLIIGGLLGLCCILCCGVFGYMGYKMVPRLTNNAADINAYRDQIAKIDLPPGFEPKSGGKTDNFMFSMIFVFYENPGHARLMMGQFGSKMGGGPEMQGGMRQQFEVQRSSEFHDMANEKTETRNLKIKGHEYPFVFATGEEEFGAGPGRFGRRRDRGQGSPEKEGGKENGKKEGKSVPLAKKEIEKPDAGEKKEGEKKSIHHRISGSFDGKQGLAEIVIDFDDTYKEADIVKMIENIQ